MNAGQTAIDKVKNVLRQPYAWPGGYPIQFFSYDGCICHKCVRSNFRAVVADTKMGVGPWNVVPEILWEPYGACIECGEELESAY